ncbi:MAG: N-acyl homoserine lactonase family protein [Clostridiales Family XIII bacterium]|jgi:glyoxylase-like metal-dependent hydrolase (beta-lactamase superfamily II)|nr:N-acyl homoserine lactonase family protein [Clostridiales Family XIII bacterium]
MKLYILNLGKMQLDESALVAGIHGGSLRNQNPVAQWVDIPVQAALVDYGDGYLLYDTGCNIRERFVPDDEDTPSPFHGSEDGLIEPQLAALGVRPDDVKYVVMSHLHCDHAGYLYLFKNAQVITADKEFSQSMRLFGLRGFGPGPYKYADFDAFLQAGLDWRLIPEGQVEYEIVPGVKAVNFGTGHTFSLTGLYVELPRSGNFLFTADALYRSENLGPPIRIPGLIYDSISYVKSAELIAGYAAKTKATIIFGHDKRQFATLDTAPDYYD